ncbi:shikimate dehydrogenase family protein [Larsenimonas rhizosphaerae]|uniref:shikimate dehydrogenase family protein n=1 Tax=Larsenimonas rhizosphaerae TaxID=2944682 RepID=UPI0020335FBE|nr:shikimate dehydrogenase [Larsenimonas rhizosphaerae]MCM2131519.1 shikimate dehydrogenase [Larsenimonas rhizosphaerae]
MRLGLIGKAILRSSAPDLHHRLGRLTGIPVTYDLFDAQEIQGFTTLENQVRTLMAAGYRGTNVTYPFKEQALHLATSCSDGAALVGSSNTLVFERGQVHAENTDFSGFISGFRAAFGARAPGRVVVIGTGGVGRAVAFALGRLGASAITLVDIDPDKARGLAAALNQSGFPAVAGSVDRLTHYMDACDGLVNCTPLGHEKSPGCPFPVEGIRPSHWVFDAVYVPARTTFIQRSDDVGADVMSGVHLFVFQGVDAFRVFCDDESRRGEVDCQAAPLLLHYQRVLMSPVA